MDMKAIVEFLQRYIQHDYETRLASYTETSDQDFQRIVDGFDQFYSSDERVYAHVKRGNFEGMDEETRAKMQSMAKRVVPRVLFLVRKYKHPKLGDLFRGYLSDNVSYGPDSLNGYSQAVYVAPTGEGPRIISIDDVCADCEGKGTLYDETCSDCKGSGYKHRQGKNISKPGKLLEAFKLQAPTEPVSLADYESEAA